MKSAFTYPLLFWLDDEIVCVTEYVGCGKFRGLDEEGNVWLYPWEALRGAELASSVSDEHEGDGLDEDFWAE